MRLFAPSPISLTAKPVSSPGEYEYSYLEQVVEGDDDTIATKTGKRTFKKDIIKAEIKLIDYPGEPQGRVPRRNPS